LTQPYSYVRFRWIDANLDELEKILAEFNVEKRQMPTSMNDISPYNRYREYLLVKADTLNALVSPLRTVLAQKKRFPFTRRDMALREIILREFPNKTSTFFPWGFSGEPLFRTEAGVKNVR
jgi:hypothetical protein